MSPLTSHHHHRRSIPKSPLRGRQMSTTEAGSFCSSPSSSSEEYIVSPALPNSNQTNNQDAAPQQKEQQQQNQEQQNISTSSNERSILFKSILLKRRDTLTFREQSYLEELVHDYDSNNNNSTNHDFTSQAGEGEVLSSITNGVDNLVGRVDDDDLYTAMMVLADENLFPKPNNGSNNNIDLECNDDFNEDQQHGRMKTPDAMLISIPSNSLTEQRLEICEEEGYIDIFAEEEKGENKDIEVSQSCSFTLPFTTTTRNSNTDVNTDMLIENKHNAAERIRRRTIKEAVKEEHHKLKKKLGLFNRNAKQLLNFKSSTDPSPDGDEDDENTSLCNSFENVEIVEMAGNAIVLQDCQPKRIKTEESALSPMTTSPNSITNPDLNYLNNHSPKISKSFEFTTPTRSNRTIDHFVSTTSNTSSILLHPITTRTTSLSSSFNTNNKTSGTSTNKYNKFENKLYYTTPMDPNKTSMSSSIGGGLSIGSSKRMSRVLERKNSIVHARMWKAHRSGITLTPPPLRHSSLNGSNRSESPCPQPRFGTPWQNKTLHHQQELRRSNVSKKEMVGSDSYAKNNMKVGHPLVSTSSARRRAYINHHHRISSSNGGIGGSSSAPSYSIHEASFGSLRQANHIFESSSNSISLTKSKSGFVRQLSENLNEGGDDDDSSIKSKHSRRSSLEFLDLATQKRRWIKSQQLRLLNNKNYYGNWIVGDKNSADSASLDLASHQKSSDLQIGKTSTNSILLESHPLQSSSTSLQSLDLARLERKNSSVSLSSNLALFTDSSMPSIRKSNAIHNYSSQSVLETIQSEDVEKFPFQNTTNIRPIFNLQSMRGKSIMSLASSKASLDDSFLTSSSNLWMKPGIAFDDSDLRSCMSDDSTLHVSEKLQSLKTPSNFPSGHIDDDISWDETVDENQEAKFDPWNLLVDEYEEYGYGLRGLPFQILGTSCDDDECQPHVLSPPLMESIFQFLPYAVSEENFWIKYSLLRDGASFFSLMQNVRGSKSTLIAIETVDGEVFGSFTNTAWRKNQSFFGSGEAFLWRMRNDRKTVCKSILDQARIESEIEVFPWTGANYMIQLCDDTKIAIGGTTASTSNAGFGLCIDDQVLHGTSSYCTTFNNPPLSKEHQDGSPFEIVNLEVWTLTPSMSVEEAEKLEFGRLFLDLHRQNQ